MDNLLTITETAERLRVSPSMVRKILKTDGLGHVRVGTRVVIPENLLQVWIDAHVRNGGKCQK